MNWFMSLTHTAKLKYAQVFLAESLQKVFDEFYFGMAGDGGFGSVVQLAKDTQNQKGKLHRL